MPGSCRRGSGKTPNGTLGESLVGTQLYTRGVEGKALSERSYPPSRTLQPELRLVGTNRCWWPRSGVNHLMAEPWSKHTHGSRDLVVGVDQSSRGRRICSRTQGPCSFPRDKPSVGLDADSTLSNHGRHPYPTMWLHVSPVMHSPLSTELLPRTKADSAAALSAK